MQTQSAKIRKATQEMGGDPKFELANTFPTGTTVFYTAMVAAVAAGILILWLLVSNYEDSSGAAKASSDARPASSRTVLEHRDEAALPPAPLIRLA